MSVAAMSFVDRCLAQIAAIDGIRRTGRVRKVLSTAIEADGPSAPLGSLCRIAAGDGATAPLYAEIVRLDETGVTLAPLDRMDAAAVGGARVEAITSARTTPVGDAFRGRVVDAFGAPLDGGGPIAADTLGLLDGAPTAPLDRATATTPLETGVRAIDGLFTIGAGQRIGVFAAAGVGKSSLLAQLAVGTGADRCVVCLVGERGREVEQLWSRIVASGRAARTTLVAATADQTAARKVRAVDHALALAEHWRGEGHHVLLLLDSVTRLAMALREIGLAAGEPATVRAYTPSVFAALPRVVERCGALKAGGAITAVMAVLAETDEVDDPVSETMRSLLDGHIVLSRQVAEQGVYPAIDAPRSLSRLAGALVDPAHRRIADRALALFSAYAAAQPLIEAGVYQRGASADIDEAMARRPGLLAFMRQSEAERITFDEARRTLAGAMGETRA